MPNNSPKGLLPAGSKYSLRRNAIISSPQKERTESLTSDCTFQADVDYDQGTFWVQNKSKDQVRQLLHRSPSLADREGVGRVLHAVHQL